MMVIFNVLIAISAALAIALGLANSFELFAIFKSLTTVLILCALIQHRQVFSRRAFQTFVLALLACLAGDIFLLDHAYFIAGLSAFLVGHLLLVRLFVMLGGWSWKMTPLFVLLLLGGGYFGYLAPSLGELKLPVALYSCVIIIMAWQGINLSLKSTSPKSGMLAAGAILFMFSDSMIAYNKFVQPFELSVLTILVTYWLSLTMILNALIAMARHEPNID